MTTIPAPDRGAEARRSLERTAERLYAEEGLAAVSLRRINDASGQRNKSALQYHFRSRGELVLAVVERHAAAIAHRRAALPRPAVLDTRARMQLVVRPVVEHLAALGSPSWCARFTAQVLGDPQLRDEALVRLLDPTPHPVPDALRATAAPGLVARTGGMLRALCVDATAELEGELAARHTDPATAAAAWAQLGDQLVDAMTAVVEALLGPEHGART